jgi:uncharacterized delta-60 repeat protein
MKHFFLFSLLLTLGLVARTQVPSVDRTFNSQDKGFGSGDSFDGFVKDAVVQQDGKILIGGYFLSYNGTMKSNLLRLNEDGSLDQTFGLGMGVDNPVYAIAVQPDGRILIGGYFTSYDGVPRTNIARLTREGYLDTTFNPGESTDGLIESIVLQPDGKILIGGHFIHYNGHERNYIARLNTDGTVDETFRSPLDMTEGGYVNTITLQSDGRILMGGIFLKEDRTAVIRIMRLNSDGSFDTTFSPKSYIDDTILSIAVQKDGRILIAGALSVYNYPIRNHIVRLNADGGLDETFRNIGTDDWTSLIYKIILQEDGHILVAGSFTSYGGQPRNRINRLNEDGTNDPSFLPGTGADGEITLMTIDNNGRTLIGGDFRNYQGKRAVKIARLSREGLLDNSFNKSTGADRTISTMALQQDGKIIISGLSSYFGVARNSIARINSNGSLDNSFDPGTGADEHIDAVTIQQDGKILIGGSFTSFNGTSRNHIARLNIDGSLDRAFNSSTDYTVSSITIQADGKILIGGSFTNVNGSVRNRIARLNANGTIDAGFNPGNGANGGVAAICVQPDGKILIGGYFTSYNGVARSRVARLNADGTLDTGFTPSTSFLGGHTAAIILQPDGRVLIGGSLYSIHNPDFITVIRLNDNGGYDESFDAGMGANGPVQTMALQGDGKVLLGGYFNWFNGLTRNYMIRLQENGIPDTAFNAGAGTNDYINSILLQEDTKILIGGAFTSYDGVGRNRIARLINGDVVTIAKTAARNKRGLSSTSLTKLNIYPVPATHTLHVANPSGTKMRVVVFDNLGKKVYQGDLQGTQLSINVSRWVNGAYHLVATDLLGQQKISQSFIKQ